MWRLLLLLVLFSLAAEPPSLEEDTTLYHQVHVISGHLNLHFCDVQVKGAAPLSLERTYCSAGALFKRAVDRMSSEQQQLVKQNIISCGLGPALSVSKDMVFDSVNIYSKWDFVTLGFAHPSVNLPNLLQKGVRGIYYDMAMEALGLKEARRCNLKFVPCISTKDQRIGGIIDHSFLGETYKQALKKEIGRFGSKYGIYNGED